MIYIDNPDAETAPRMNPEAEPANQSRNEYRAPDQCPHIQAAGSVKSCMHWVSNFFSLSGRVPLTRQYNMLRYNAEQRAGHLTSPGVKQPPSDRSSPAFPTQDAYTPAPENSVP